jgi:hypothetical protein
MIFRCGFRCGQDPWICVYVYVCVCVLVLFGLLLSGLTATRSLAHAAPLARCQTRPAKSSPPLPLVARLLRSSFPLPR